MARRHKQGGRYTEPDFPPRVIARERGVIIENRYGGGDHGPPHLHVVGLHVVGRGVSTKIGQNGRSLRNYPPLSPVQRVVVLANRRAIRNAIRRIGRWHWFEALP